MSDAVLIIFVREPVPGATKTRLARVVGNDVAAALYRHFVEDLLERLRPGPYDILVACTPPESHMRVQDWLGGRVVPQDGADLGERMHHALARVFAKGAGRAVVIGSDLPHLPQAAVVEALGLLDSRQLVVGPSDDGGYYLIGMRQLHPEVFQEIAWSTPQVLEQTLARASHLRSALLDTRFDVDTFEDLQRLILQRDNLDIGPTLREFLGTMSPWTPPASKMS